MSQNAILEAIHHRRSVRAYTDQPVDREQLTTILKAAQAAPSARDQRPWRFVALDDRAVLKELASGLANAAMLAEAPAALAIGADVRQAVKPETDYWVVDGALAAQNALLAAEALGLAAVYTGVWPYPDRTAWVSRVLKLPEFLRPLALIPIGHAPEGGEKPKDKWNPDHIRWNSWS